MNPTNWSRLLWILILVAQAAKSAAGDVPAPEELLASTRADYRPAFNGHRDTSGRGVWSYHGLANATAQLLMRPLRDMEWVAADGLYSSPSIRRRNARACGIFQNNDGYLDISAADAEQIAIVRWTSGERAAISLRAKFVVEAGERSEVGVVVDGVCRAYRETTGGTADLQAEAIVGPTSTVDFVVFRQAGRITLEADIMRASGDAILALEKRVAEAVANSSDSVFDGEPIQLRNISDIFKERMTSSFVNSIKPEAQLLPDALQFLKEYVEVITDPRRNSEVKRRIAGLTRSGRQLVDAGVSDHRVVIAQAHCEIRSLGSEDSEPLPKLTKTLGDLRGRMRQLALQAKDPMVKYVLGTIGARIFYGRFTFWLEGAQSASDGLYEMASAKDITDDDRRLIVHLLTEEHGEILEPTMLTLAGRFTQPEVDTWLRDIVQAQELSRVAWLARGKGYASTVSEHGWRYFELLHENSRLELLRAWERAPELPHAAVALMGVSHSNVRRHSQRFWRDQAIAADCEFSEIYRDYLWSLRPRWGGSHEAMLEFAKELIDSGWYTTGVPGESIQAMVDVAGEVGTVEFFQRPDIVKAIEKLADGYRDTDQGWRNYILSLLLAIKHRTGNQEDARELFAELGEAANSDALSLLNVSARTLRQEYGSGFRETINHLDQLAAGGVTTKLLFIPSGRGLISFNRDGEVHLWRFPQLTSLGSIKVHDNPLVDGALSDDGAHLAVISRDGDVAIVQLKQRQIINRIQLGWTPKTVVPHPTGWLVGGVRNDDQQQAGIAVVWDGKAADVVDDAVTSPFPISHFRWQRDNPDAQWGVLFASVQSTGQMNSQPVAVRFDIDSLHPLGTVQSGQLEHVVVSPMGFRMGTAPSGNLHMERGGVPNDQLTQTTISVTSSNGGQATLAFTGLVSDMICSQDGQYLVVAGTRGQVNVYDLLDGAALTRRIPLLGAPASLAVAPDAQHVAIVDSAGRVGIHALDAPTGPFAIETHEINMTSLRHGGGVVSIQRTPAGFAISGRFQSASFWRADNQFSSLTMPLNRRALLERPMAISPDGRWAVEGGHSELLLWDLNSDPSHSTVHSVGQPRGYSNPRFSQDGKWIVYSDEKSWLYIHDVATDRLLATLGGSEMERRAFDVSPDRTLLATATRNQKSGIRLQLFDLPPDPNQMPRQSPPWFRATFQPRYHLDHYAELPRQVEFSPDARTLLVSHSSVDVIDVETSKVKFSLPGVFGTFSGDGDKILTAGGTEAPTVASVWDLNGERICTFDGWHEGMTQCGAFSPDGRHVVTGDLHGNVFVWSAENGELAPLKDVAANWQPSAASPLKVAKPRLQLVNSAGLRFLQVPAGKFTMGSPESEPGRLANEIPHEVTISKPYWIGTSEVDIAAFHQVMGRVASKFRMENRPMATGGPASGVTWDEANEFCRRLSSDLREQGAGRRYRLPTEAEWEYACRAGTQTAYAFGDEMGIQHGNVDGKVQFSGTSHPIKVEVYPPNAFGLHDMHGNVWEWCQDWFAPYDGKPAIDPTGPATGTRRTMRGGGFFVPVKASRSALRNSELPTYSAPNLGFRVVCELSE